MPPCLVRKRERKEIREKREERIERREKRGERVSEYGGLTARES